MSDTLYDSLVDYLKLGRTSFHTPGHKGQKIFKENIMNLDLTELPLTDSLFESSGCIKKSEDSMAELYKTKKTLFSSGGNTLCIQTMIALAVGCNGKMLVGRNVHKSVISTMALLNITPVWIMNNGDSGIGIPGRISSDNVYKHLKKDKDIKGVFVTSPDYYGVVSDIKKISEVCKKFQVPLLVDNAHGSHFMFMDENIHPINFGATMSADSVHKTLPVMTGGALLHINCDKYIDTAKGYMGIFGSTSPSYPVMASIDLCEKWLRSEGKNAYNRLKERVLSIKKEAEKIGIFMPSGECDPVRITLNVASVGYSGEEFRNYLYEYNIEPEFCDDNYVVLIPTPFNSESDFQRLISALKNVKVKKSKCVEGEGVSLPEVKLSIREAVFSRCETVDVNSSCGRVAAEIACPCPPGVPVVMPGEIIGQYQKSMLIRYGISEVKVIK